MSVVLSNPQVGSIVRCRERQWVVLPSEQANIIRLRPLSGNEEQICGIYTILAENIEPGAFPLPHTEYVRNHQAGRLLLDAARLSLRSGAGPFRCLGRLSVRPRPYQIVPLLMALRQETIRLLISDDVGIGKTIEALLIARELLDRGEIKRIGVLCPPQLCDQWQRELKEKFNIDAVVIRSGTANKLEKELPSGISHIFSYYRHIIVSFDYAKSERRRASFLAYRPDLVIVDEVHTATQSREGTKQQRYQLIAKLAEKPQQHLVFLTATPHSGIEQSFLSILGFLKPEFSNLKLDDLAENQRVELAKYFVQRRRADVKHWMNQDTPFPQRESLEYPYTLSREYRDLFEKVFNFARGLVQSVDETFSYAQKKGRYWSALAIIRCVMSSPQAAIATLSKQTKKDLDDTDLIHTLEELDLSYDRLASSYVYDSTEQEQSMDVAPSVVVEQGTKAYQAKEKRKLREFVKLAAELTGKKDQKLQQTIKLVQDLLEKDYHPILWCRYIATAKYYRQTLQEAIEKKQGSQVRIIAITGESSENEREIRLEELKSYPKRVLVATDCLSEGINLQEHFNACIHIDLPFNPNRLEQREGRIDRYGQPNPQVKCILMYGQDNPVDGAILEVLLRKAVTIHRSLGITVPVPMDSTTVQEAVFKSLFEHSITARQLSLFDYLQEEDSPLSQVHHNWDKAVEREKQNRTLFAQRAIKPHEVEQELIEADEILGNETDVERFITNACNQLGSPLVKKKHKNKQWWELATIPPCLQPTIGDKPRKIAFTTPIPAEVEYIGRNHPMVAALARYLFEQALDIKDSIASRCGVTVTNSVTKPTFIFLLRLRHLLTGNKTQPLLAEECLVRGFTGTPNNPLWLSQSETLNLLDQTIPTGDIDYQEKQRWIEKVINRLDDLIPSLSAIAHQRSEDLLKSHQRVRKLSQEGKFRQIEPQLPMDILGIYILLHGY